MHDDIAVDRRSLGLSVAWGYAFGLLLFAFVITILMPEADGPSPWDPAGVRARA